MSALPKQVSLFSCIMLWQKHSECCCELCFLLSRFQWRGHSTAEGYLRAVIRATEAKEGDLTFNPHGIQDQLLEADSAPPGHETDIIGPNLIIDLMGIQLGVHPKASVVYVQKKRWVVIDSSRKVFHVKREKWIIDSLQGKWGIRLACFFILGHKGFIHPLLIITEYCSAKHTICRMKAEYIMCLLIYKHVYP